MVYMPADVLGWRPAARSWLVQYLANHAAQANAAAAKPAGAALDAGPLSAEASQLQSPASPGLPGFGKAGVDSFRTGICAGKAGSSAGAGRGNDSASCMQCPQEMHRLRDALWGMFEKFAEPLLQWVAIKGTLVVQLSPATLMASVTTLLGIQLDTLAK